MSSERLGRIGPDLGGSPPPPALCGTFLQVLDQGVSFVPSLPEGGYSVAKKHSLTNC